MKSLCYVRLRSTHVLSNMASLWYRVNQPRVQSSVYTGQWFRGAVSDNVCLRSYNDFLTDPVNCAMYNHDIISIIQIGITQLY